MIIKQSFLKLGDNILAVLITHKISSLQNGDLLFDVLDESDYNTDIRLRNVSESDHHLFFICLICDDLLLKVK